jgi:superfamily II DNA/RNA helicase
LQYVHRCGRAGRNKVSGGASGDKKHLNSVVYSFFNRELAPMAKDVIDLLKSSNSWIDPNLIALVPGGVEGCDSKRKRRRRNKEVEQDQPDNSEDLKTAVLDMGENSDDNDFASLGQNRIVLKRASHVKDDSDGE